MLSAAPEICAERIQARDHNNHEYESSVEGLQLQEIAELYYFNKIVTQFSSSLSGAAVIYNESTLEQLYAEVRKFIQWEVSLVQAILSLILIINIC